MSGYEVEHNIPSNQAQPQPTRRPDLSTFFSTLDQVDTTGSRQPQNANALPLPGDISAAFRLLANAFDLMRAGTGTAQDQGHNDLMDSLVESLMVSADHPPAEVQGVSDEFLQELERIPKKQLKHHQSCPICSNPFLDDPHPLVVKLPCHGGHTFDLECIQPWLKLNPTCPMDRQKLLKEKPKPPPASDEDREYDDMYA